MRKHIIRNVLLITMLVTAGAPMFMMAAQTPVDAPMPATSEADLDFDRIEQDVAQLRELPLQEDVDEEIVDSDVVRAELEEQFESEWSSEAIELTSRTYEAFGLVPQGTDFEAILLELLTEQVVGRYFPESGRLYIVAADGEMGALEEATYAHEVVHALQDQHFGLEDLFIRTRETTEDESLAISALIEGDATLGQALYVQQNPELAQELQAQVESGGVNMQALRQAPPLLAATLLFPYEHGGMFVQALFEQDGFEAVDAVYMDVPETTEQILHPERYIEGDPPTMVTLPALGTAFGNDWSLVGKNVFGEFQISVLLSGAVQPSDEA